MLLKLYYYYRAVFVNKYGTIEPLLVVKRFVKCWQINVVTACLYPPIAFVLLDMCLCVQCISERFPCSLHICRLDELLFRLLWTYFLQGYLPMSFNCIFVIVIVHETEDSGFCHILICSLNCLFVECFIHLFKYIA